MSYTKTTWNTGDVITADKLNKMEDGISDKGYSVEQSMKDLFVGSVTTESDDKYACATISLDEPLSIAPDEIEIVIDNTTYTASSKSTTDGGIEYGGDLDVEANVIDFSEYPFFLAFSDGEFYLTTETPKTCTRISTPASVVSASPEFETAVKSCGGPFVVHVTDDTLDKTFNEIAKEFVDGRMCVLIPPSGLEQAIIFGINMLGCAIKILSVAGNANAWVVIYAADSPDENPQFVSSTAINKETPVILRTKSVAGENEITYMVLYHDDGNLVKQGEFMTGSLTPERYKNYILCSSTSTSGGKTKGSSDQSITESVSYLHQTHSVLKQITSGSPVKVRTFDRLTFENNPEFQYGEINSADGPDFECYYYVVQ